MITKGEPPFVLLPDENLKYKSPLDRTSLIIEAATRARQIKAEGKVYLSNKRMVFVSSHGDIKSFAVFFSQIKTSGLGGESYLDKPNWWKSWLSAFGASQWHAVFTVEQKDGGLDPSHVHEVWLTFKEGGITEFVEIFNKLHHDVVNSQVEEDILPAYTA